MRSPSKELRLNDAVSVGMSANQRHGAPLRPAARDAEMGLPRGPRMILVCVLLFAMCVLLHVFREQLLMAAMPMPAVVAPAPRLSQAAPISVQRSPQSPPTAAVQRPTVAPRAAADSFTARRAQVNAREIFMDDVEVDLVVRHLGGVRNYLEWGSGGSTHNFARFAQKRAVSIEHDPEWCAQTTWSIKRARIRPVEVRCVRNSTAFNLDGDYREFREYIDEIAKLGEPLWDFVLVDGRCRVGAAIRALSYVSNNSVLVLHDSERMRQNGALYGRILDYYDVMDSAGGPNKRGVAVLKRKKALGPLQGDHEKVQTILNNVFGMKK